MSNPEPEERRQNSDAPEEIPPDAAEQNLEPEAPDSSASEAVEHPPELLEPAPPPAPPAPTLEATRGWEPEIETEAEPGSAGQRSLLLFSAIGLGVFVLVAGAALAAAVFLYAPVRDRVFGTSGAPPEGPDKFASEIGRPIQISDTFDLPSNRWDQSRTEVVDETYEMALDLDNFDSYGLLLRATGVRDFDLSVDAVQTTGDPVAEWGIRFRQSAPDEHLMFSIAGTGHYRLLRVSDATYTSVVPWRRDRRINTGIGATNRLRVVADGPLIIGYINDVEVLRYTDPEPQGGQLTLGLITYDVGGLTVRWDDVAGFAVRGIGFDGAVGGQVDLAEDFSNPLGSSWTVGGAEIVDGAYEVFVGGAGVQSWQQPLPTGSSEIAGNGFVLEVDAELISGNPAEAGYGVVFADSGDFSFIALYLLPTGQLLLVQSGPDGGLLVPPTVVEAVQPGLNAQNRIRLEARDNLLRITINEESLGELRFPTDTRFTGMVGMIVLSPDVAGVRARFDNFRLEEIDQSISRR
jgi:hypothetical protein